jgi:hypothetical protein
LLTPLQFTKHFFFWGWGGGLISHNVSRVLGSDRAQSRKVKVIPSRAMTGTKGKYRHGSTYLSPRQSMGLGGQLQVLRAEESYYPLHKKRGGPRGRSGQV